MKSNTAKGSKDVDELLLKREQFSSQQKAIDNLLKNKTSDHTEIEVCFFHTCNISCRFCWQSSTDVRGEELIKEKADIVIDYLAKAPIKDRVQIHLLGGEIFDDGYARYGDYKYFIEKIHKNIKVPYRFVFLTNMNWATEETDASVADLILFMENLGVPFNLTTSWDPSGRPVKGETTTTFHKNIVKYAKYISEITFVLTKASIEKLLNRQTPYLDILIDLGFTIDIDYYMPTEDAELLMPTDRLLLEAFLCLHKHYPDIQKMKSVGEAIGKMTCASNSKVTIMPDGSLTCCRHIEYSQDEFNSEIQKETNAPLILKFLEKKGCLSCKHFSYCPFTCFVMDDHKTFKKELDDCYYKLFFDTVMEK